MAGSSSPSTVSSETLVSTDPPALSAHTINRTPFDLSGKNIVVLGGTGVIGKAIVSSLFQHGASVAVVSRSAEKADVLIDHAKALPKFFETSSPINHLTVVAEDASVISLTNARDTIFEHYKRVDGLVCLVGGNRPESTVTPDKSPFAIPTDEIRKTFELNLYSGFLEPLQIFGPLLAEQASPVSIIATSSMAALRPLSRVGAYGAAKAALQNFMQSSALEIATRFGDQIRINAIVPGFLLTEQNRFLLVDKDTGAPTARGESVLRNTPFNRYGRPDEIAGPSVFLLSDASSFMTGALIPVDGGFSINSI